MPVLRRSTVAAHVVAGSCYAAVDGLEEKKQSVLERGLPLPIVVKRVGSRGLNAADTSVDLAYLMDP